MKRWTLFILVLSLIFVSVSTVQAVDSLTDIQFFPKDHIWNVRVDNLPLDSHSATYINGINRYADNLGYNQKMPINVVGSSVSHKTVTFRAPYSTDPGPYPIPSNPLIQGGPDITVPGDHHLLIVDRDEKKLYELYDPTLKNGVWSAYSGAVFDLNSYSLRPEDHSSADAAGLPMVPGIVRYDELMSGQVDHALRISVWVTNKSWVWPARNAASDYTNGQYPPMGTRIRLKSSFDTSGYPPQSKAILEVLKKYGAMVADNGALFRVYLEEDSRWTDADLEELNTVLTTNFEVVDVSSLMINKDSGQTRVTSTITSAPSITVTSPNGGETWQRGTTKTITWSYTGNPGSTVKIVLLKGGTQVGTIKDSWSVGSSGKGSYSWPMSTSGMLGSDFKVRVQSISQPAIKDESNNYITITSESSAPSITVTSPNGGETWQRGTTKTITWSYTGNPGSTVKIVLLKGSTQVGTIKDSWSVGSSGKGSYSWPMSTSGMLGSDFRVRVQSISQPAIKDESNNYITFIL